MLILKSKKLERRTTDQYSILHSIAESKGIILLSMMFLVLSGCASFARKDIGYGLPYGYRGNQPLPYDLVVRKFNDERPVEERVSSLRRRELGRRLVPWLFE
jgi:hypothetical protein